jgi:hypothetical protein
MGFRTSTDGQTGSGFQDLDKQMHRSPRLGICKMGIKRIRTRSQRITSSGYLKKNSESKNRCRFWLFQKNLTKLLGFTKTRKRGARQVFGWLFYFYNLGSGFQILDRRTDNAVICLEAFRVANPGRACAGKISYRD